MTCDEKALTVLIQPALRIKDMAWLQRGRTPGQWTLEFLYGPEILRVNVRPTLSLCFLGQTSNWNLKFPIPRFLWH